MTRATATFLVRLQKFLDASPASKREELFALYKDMMGKKLDRRTLDHWLVPDRGITLCCAFPLMRFMQLNDQIIPGTKESGLFHYVVPEKTPWMQSQVAKGKFPAKASKRAI